MTGVLIPADPRLPARQVSLEGDYLGAIGRHIAAPVDVVDLLDANGEPSGMSVWYSEDGRAGGLAFNVEASRLVHPDQVWGPALITASDPDDPDATDLVPAQLAIVADLLDLPLLDG